MRSCEYDGTPFTEPRDHPWAGSVASAEHRFVDLRADPSQIRTAMEDFVPWSHYPAIDEFYSLLEWLNAPASRLESNDCAFTGPHANDAPSFAKALQCSGRVMILFHALAKNLSRPRIDALKDALHRSLATIDPDFPWGIVGTTILPVRYVTLPLPEDAQLGSQLMISFWAWGSTEGELMENLGRVLRNVAEGLKAPLTASVARS